MLLTLAATFPLSCLSPALFAQSNDMSAPDMSAPQAVEALEAVGEPSSPLRLRDVARWSIVGMPGDTREWAPLTHHTFLTEGWREPWIPHPVGTGGAPRDGWLNTLDGFFPRSANVLYGRTYGRNEDGSQFGTFQFVTPLSRRLFIGIDGLGLVDSPAVRRTGSGLADLVVTPRVMIHETKNLSLSAGASIRVPIGDDRNGENQTRIAPLFAFWTAVGGGWSVRGGAGIDIELGRSAAPDEVLFTNLAVGQTITPKEAVPFGSFTYFLSAITRTRLDDSGRTLVTLTPGIRSHIGRGFFFLFGYELPVTPSRPFDRRAVFQFVQTF
ncbi:transporter [Gemmata obscuriglobus]|nr:transporter [Gemmata obscuriglobus]